MIQFINLLYGTKYFHACIMLNFLKGDKLG